MMRKSDICIFCYDKNYIPPRQKTVGEIYLTISQKMGPELLMTMQVKTAKKI